MIKGYTYYNNIKIFQHKNFQIAFKKFFDIYKPRLILEIGTAQGGLTKFLSDISKTKILTYDPYTSPDFENYNIEHIQKDIFGDLDMLSEMIQNIGLTLVLCDGGDKIKEFKTFAPIIKSGDFIFGHDYARSLNYFKKYIKGNEWDWLELNREDIEEDITNNNLYDFMSEDFNSVVWGSFRKI